MIRIPDPARMGPSLADARELLGISRRAVARHIGEATARRPDSVNAQLWTWETGKIHPAPESIGAYLDAIEFDLALAHRSEDPKRQRVLLAAVDNALRNGSHMTGANLAFELLCDELGVTRDNLADTFDPQWSQKSSPSAPA